MSRKDYQLIADVFNKSKLQGDLLDSKSFLRYMTDALKADNPAFDRDRFLAACGIEVAQ